MIDPELLDREERAVWDRVFPGGFWAGSPHLEGPQVRLWGFAEVCQFELGRVPDIVNEAIDPELPRTIGEYMRNLRAARERGEL